MPPKGRKGQTKRGASARGGRTAAIKKQDAVVAEEHPVVEKESNGTNKDEDEDDDDNAAVEIEDIAQKYWLNGHPKWSETVVASILDTHIVGSKFARSTLQGLERLQYFEQYLWPHYKPSSMSDGTLVTILLMLNEKHIQGLSKSTWAFINKGPNANGATFGSLFDDIIAISLRNIEIKDDPTVRSLVAQFLVMCFSSLETASVRDACMPLTSLLVWSHIDDSRRLVDEMFERTPQLHKLWKHLSKKCMAGNKKNTAPEEAARYQRDRDYLPALIRDFVECVLNRGSNGAMLAYCVKFLELLIDLESQLPTRRYVNLLLVDYQVVSLCEQSLWYSRNGDDDTGDDVFVHLVDQLRDRVHFQVRDVTGEAVSEEKAKEMHYQIVQALQLVAFKEFADTLEPLALSS
ncbi:hypothetical protein EV175_003091, partial [Coemansia sp. RSA 1933]